MWSQSRTSTLLRSVGFALLLNLVLLSSLGMMLSGCSDLYFDRRETVALGADDPLLFGSRLAAQYSIAREVHGFTDTELAVLARTSVLSSTAPESVRSRLLAGIDVWAAYPPGPAPEGAQAGQTE